MWFSCLVIVIKVPVSCCHSDSLEIKASNWIKIVLLWLSLQLVSEGFSASSATMGNICCLRLLCHSSRLTEQKHVCAARKRLASSRLAGHHISFDSESSLNFPWFICLCIRSMYVKVLFIVNIVLQFHLETPWGPMETNISVLLSMQWESRIFLHL